MTRTFLALPLSDHTVYGRRGMCATSHPLAAQAGLCMLKDGGTAVDAAVAMAAALTVVEPTSNGIGSDAFALVWSGERLYGLNGSGRSPMDLSRGALPERGYEAMPARGWLPVTVPGAPAAWRDLHRRFGRLSFPSVLKPAVELAEGGHPVAPVVSRYWSRAYEAFSGWTGPEFHGWHAVFAPYDRGPHPGEIVKLADHARTLTRIAETEAEDFYRGGLAEAMDAFSRETGGLLRKEDLAAHESTWVEPIAARYRDAELFEIPPNTQGIVALAALRILDGLSPGASWEDPAAVHAAIEAIKLGFADAREHVSDPEHLATPAEELLDESYVATRRASIRDVAELRETGLPRRGGTVFLVAADADGMMVSFIQSNYMGFGSGVVVPGTGIALQNRGRGFTLEPGHPNEVGPAKRPFHTIIPGFLVRDGKPWGPLGVMGGHMQPQGHVQVVRALVDFAFTPQAALDLPRWRWSEGLRVEVEPGFPEDVIRVLGERGHRIVRAEDSGPFGRGQIIHRAASGVLAGGSDRRADGQVLAY